jgi:glycosyltransferase involved in cell wall biosynthesis
MKVLIVSTYDIQGGAARAAHRLHKALLGQNVDSQMLVQSKSSDDFTVIGPQSKVQKAFAKLRPTLDSLSVRKYKDRTKTPFSPSRVPFSDVVDKINNINPDIVHLHWIVGGILRIEDFAKIKVPIVWSLHDMWAFTGGCHYDEECGAYQKQCGTCPVLGSNKLQDLSRKVWLRKQATFGKMANLNIIGLSKWLADCAKQSSLFKGTPVFNLPNPIDTDAFAPLDKQQARAFLNLPQDKKLILFGAIGAVSDPRKGFKELAEALTHLDADNTELVVFGSSQPKTSQGFKQKAHYLGQLYDDVSLRVLYSAADVMIVPSLQENLSNAIMESLACGTPVVGFAIGGNSDLIVHQITGYLAKPYNVTDLAQGIEWVMNASNCREISQSSREKVLREFDSQVVAKRYIDLYNQIIKGAV